MATTVAAITNLNVIQTRSITGGNLGSPSDKGTFTFPNTNWGSGTSAGSLEECFHGTITVNGTNANNLDLAGGLTIQGTTITFTKIKQLWLRHASTNFADVITVGAGSNPWITWINAAGTLQLKPGMALGFADYFSTGFAVTGGTGDILKMVSNGTNDVSVDVLISGNKT